MRFMSRVAFYKGVVVGVIALAGAGAVALTYLLTDKVPVANIGKDGTRVTLVGPGEVAGLVREQIEKARASKQAQQSGGDGDGED